MLSTDLFTTVLEQLRSSGSVESVFGEPIVTGERTVVPVARVAYGFGGGYGTDGPDAGDGGGLGGGVSVSPIGVLELDATGVRFVRFGDRRRLAAATGIGVLIGLLASRLRRR